MEEKRVIVMLEKVFSTQNHRRKSQNVVKIVPYKNENREFVDALIKETCSDSTIYPYSEETINLGEAETQSTYIAKVGAIPVGFCSMWLNGFHPYALYFTIHTSSNYSKICIRTLMYNHILSINKKYRCIQTSLWEADSETMGFLSKKGFILYRKTIEPKLRIINNDKVILRKVNKDVFKKYKLLTLQQLTDERKYNEFIELTKKCYELSHKENPLGKISIEKWKNTVECDLIKAASLVLVDNDRVIAFALMHESTILIKDLGWRGVHSLYEEEMHEIIIALTYNQIEYARGADVESLIAEIDSTDIFASIMHGNFPFDKVPVWLTYYADLTQILPLECL
ncbi:hypothetical protein JYU11_03195 [bacterium AH-315-G05]|nr:hypothetical protein [bacterium AH-315-G05]